MIYGTRPSTLRATTQPHVLVSQGGKAGIAKLKYTIRDSKSDIIYLADQSNTRPEFPTRVHFNSVGKFIQKDKIKFVAGGKDRFLKTLAE